MRLALANEKIIGEKIANPLYNSNGILFMKQGTEITSIVLKHIRRAGLTTVYIEDSNEEIVLEELVDTKERLRITKILKEQFTQIKKQQKFDYMIIKDLVVQLIENINLSENAYQYNNIEVGDELAELVTHSLNVAILSIITGLQLKYSYDRVLSLGIGALLHDVGKIISSKEDHTLEGYKFLKNTPNMTATMLSCVRQHHEKMDGSGVPSKMVGEQIYDYARIVSVCDFYVNQVSKENNLPHEVIEQIVAQGSTAFDVDIVRVFTQSFICYPNGLGVKLNNGVKGIVVRQNKNFPQRPIIQVFREGKKELINLIKELTIFVETVEL